MTRIYDLVVATASTFQLCSRLVIETTILAFDTLNDPKSITIKTSGSDEDPMTPIHLHLVPKTIEKEFAFGRLC